MKSFKLLITGAFVFALVTPVLWGRVASAQPIEVTDNPPLPLLCNIGEFEFTSEGCDLAVDKKVSVNGGTFADADTSADAAQGNVGDTVTWQITVSDPNSGEFGDPFGQVTVEDILPSGVAFESFTASAGTYSSNNWIFELSGNLPATLTIVSKSTATGLFQNTATLTEYSNCLESCSFSGAYSDSDSSNNSNDAWFDPAAAPVVLAVTTDPPPQVLAATGNGVTESLVAAGLITATLGILGYNHFNRKPVYYSAYVRQRRN